MKNLILLLAFWLTCYSGNKVVFDGPIDRYLLIPGGVISFFPANSDQMVTFNGIYILKNY